MAVPSCQSVASFYLCAGREIIHCPYCDYTTLLKPVMRRHLDFHENKRAFVCDAEGCGMAFNARGTLLRHKASQHEKQNKVRIGLIYDQN